MKLPRFLRKSEHDNRNPTPWVGGAMEIAGWLDGESGYSHDPDNRTSKDNQGQITLNTNDIEARHMAERIEELGVSVEYKDGKAIITDKAFLREIDEQSKNR